MYLLSYHRAMARVFVADVYTVLDKLLGTTVLVEKTVQSMLDRNDYWDSMLRCSTL